MNIQLNAQTGLGGLIILALDIYAIYSVLTSGASVVAKIVWTVIILALPIVGFIAWLLLGPKGS